MFWSLPHLRRLIASCRTRRTCALLRDARVLISGRSPFIARHGPHQSTEFGVRGSRKARSGCDRQTTDRTCTGPHAGHIDHETFASCSRSTLRSRYCELLHHDRIPADRHQR